MTGPGSEVTPEQGNIVRRTFKIELANPSEQDLQNIKNQLVERIARSVIAENIQESVAGVVSHDKHDSFHDRVLPTVELP